MNHQFKETNTEIIISDEEGNVTSRENFDNSKEILATENILEEIENKLKNLKDRKKYECGFSKRFNIALSSAFIGLSLCTILAALVSGGIITPLPFITVPITMAITIAGGTILAEIKIKKDKKLIAIEQEKLKTMKKRYLIDLIYQNKNSKVKDIENTNKENNTYEFNYSILNNSSYEYYDVEENKENLFKVKNKTK